MAFDFTALIWPVTMVIAFLIVRSFMKDHAKILQKDLAAQNGKVVTSATKNDLDLMRVKAMKEFNYIQEDLTKIKEKIAEQRLEILAIRGQVNTATKAATSAALAVGLNLEKSQ